MSSISLRLPESLHKEARELAERGHLDKPVDRNGASRKMAALLTGEYLGERAACGSRKKFDRVLRKVREKNQPPVDGHEL